MREEAHRNGECPVADNAPELWESNRLAVDIFQRAQYSGTQISTDQDKTVVYLHAADIKAYMDIYNLEAENRFEVAEKILFLQEAVNELRPRRKRK